MTVIEGCDYSTHTPGAPSAAALTAAGKFFITTYVVQDDRANTKAELAAKMAGGILIVANYESTANRMADGHDAGVWDANYAQGNLVNLGLPATMPIYFSADWPFQESDQPAIDAYLQGAASAIGADRVGVYGSVYVLQRCAQNGTAKWFWQTTAWSDGQLFAGAHLYQYDYDHYIEGVNIDLDQALQPHFGQHADYLAPIPISSNGPTGDAVTTAAANLRASPGLAAAVVGVLAAGTTVTETGKSATADGYTWVSVTTPSGAGWVATALLNPVTKPVTKPTPAPTYATPVPIPGPVVDQTLANGTKLLAFPRSMTAVQDGVTARLRAAAAAPPTAAPLTKGTVVHVNYLCRSATDGNYWVIDSAGNRIRLDDLTA